MQGSVNKICHNCPCVAFLTNKPLEATKNLVKISPTVPFICRRGTPNRPFLSARHKRNMRQKRNASPRWVETMAKCSEGKRSLSSFARFDGTFGKSSEFYLSDWRIHCKCVSDGRKTPRARFENFCGTVHQNKEGEVLLREPGRPNKCSS